MSPASRWEQTLQLYHWAMMARAEAGVPILRQLAEAIPLRFPPSRLGFSEYFDYRLFDPHMAYAEKRRFVGWRGEPALDRANHPQWQLYADDKLALLHLLSQAHIPQPSLYAVYCRKSRDCYGMSCISTAENLVDWLRACRTFPLVAKPIHGGFGRGVYLLEAYDHAVDELMLAGVGRMATEKFVAGLTDPEGLGYLFQEALNPHPALAEINCRRLSTVRVMTLTEPDGGISIYRAVWKIPRRGNVIDNFESGTTGNLLGRIEMDSGQILKVIQGFGLERQFLEVHPDSGLSFLGLELPDWQELKNLTIASARLMPEFRFQHWDMAITDRGPIPLEVNMFAAGGTELSQIVEQRGLLEERLMACMQTAA